MNDHHLPTRRIIIREAEWGRWDADLKHLQYSKWIAVVTASHPQASFPTTICIKPEKVTRASIRGNSSCSVIFTADGPLTVKSTSTFDAPFYPQRPHRIVPYSSKKTPLHQSSSLHFGLRTVFPAANYLSAEEPFSSTWRVISRSLWLLASDCVLT